MEASAISHIAICTRDMEKSLAFYRDILGMKVLFAALSTI
jgi:catechol 2,3-dioxygenase-like lactoylglutathione lyase family enzyme